MSMMYRKLELELLLLRPFTSGLCSRGPQLLDADTWEG